MLLKNTSITVKLLAMIIPLAICLVAVTFIFTDLVRSSFTETETSLYDQLYVPSAAIINADRDFYQSAIAEKELLLSWDSLDADERKHLTDDFNENQKQVWDRITIALDCIRENPVLYKEYRLSTNGKTLQQLEQSFFTSFDNWLSAYDLYSNTGNINLRNEYFNSARDDINSMTELLDEYATFIVARIENEVDSAIINSSTTVTIVLVVLMVFSVVMTLYMRNTTRYITKICKRIAEGQFNIEISPKKFGIGEIGQLCRATGDILNRLTSYVDYINEITETLGLMAEGDMRINLKHDYAGEFKPVKDALIGIRDSLSGTLLMISQSSSQVNKSAFQLASVAQNLAEGTNKQTGAVDNLSASVKDIAQQVSDNTANALSAERYAVEAGDEVMTGNNHMRDMLSAMEAINRSSTEVAKIMKVIDDIAFQTNILALNAAVEAARAGQHGKGFAVVAEEVRNLAGKSAEAASQTASLIQQSVQAAEEGQVTANSTALSLKLIEEKTLATKTLVENIASASKTQAEALVEVNDVISRISDVVQSNASTAEESSATSQELSSQALILNTEISKFKLSNDVKALKN